MTVSGHILAAPAHLVPRRVHREPAPHDRFGRRLVVRRRRIAVEVDAAQDRADAGDQQPLRKGFGDIVVGTHRESQRLVDLVVLAGEEDHRKLAFLAQAAQQLEPVHARHL